MPSTCHDGPASSHFVPVPIRGKGTAASLARADLPEAMAAQRSHAPTGLCTGWGIPFAIQRVAVLRDTAIRVPVESLRAQWLVFQHTTAVPPSEAGPDGFTRAPRGEGCLGECACTYEVEYGDGTRQVLEVLRRHHIHTFTRRWGENCFEAVQHHKPHPMRLWHEPGAGGPRKPWGQTQTRAVVPDLEPWVNWLYAWENPRPGSPITALVLQPVNGITVLSAISAGNARRHPLRWDARQKAILRLPEGERFDPALDAHGQFSQVRLDMGQIIDARPRPLYPDEAWARSAPSQPPAESPGEILIEYSAHPDATFHLPRGERIPVDTVSEDSGFLVSVAPARRRVRLRFVEKGSDTAVPVRLHLHGSAGEYLAPLDRQRIPNAAWFEDYGSDLALENTHWSAYSNGESVVDLPVGKVYLEATKGFEFAPVRRVLRIGPRTETITIELERALPWRSRGWVTADTHVHFLSPSTAALEGEAEGVNVVNLLASQWGDLMTNASDFDGKTTHGSVETGGSGEWLVRVGTENRQHVLGHISLLGYEGPPILPMCAGGPDESPIGDPVEVLMLEWARRCRQQNGLVVMPHFPDPRCENAACIVEGTVDAIEMCSWDQLAAGISPYSLSDWYRYLNCGYAVPICGGTDKMQASTPVGGIRTYAKLPGDTPFTYESWMHALRHGDTFVTFGPLLEFDLDGTRPGGRIARGNGGGTLTANWEVASCTIPVTRVELMVNGEIRESKAVTGKGTSGAWTLPVVESCWVALLVRGQHPGRPEVIAAHSSAVMIEVAGSPLMKELDALRVLEQIEGAMAYLDTVGTRAEEKRYKEMRLQLVAAYRKLHHAMHHAGIYHRHTHATDHPDHH